ncbi:MAG: hypothetical protein C0392_04030 [Syntrophus sp. (in: bacteria)]|nr:hypothetical protein [Syntrophus sp. (in: bacteria)]
MVAELIFRSKFVYPDGAIREMVLWRLPEKTADNPFGLKYRLHYGYPDGRTVIRYDNEKGKSHHKHIGGDEELYQFIDVESLVADFLSDIERARGGLQ